MGTDDRVFTCVVSDRHSKEHFFAKVKIVKKQPVRASRIDKGRIELADIFVWALADRVRAGAENYHDAHSHFVLYDITGHGKYIVRNRLVLTSRRGRVRRGISGTSRVQSAGSLV